MRRNFWLQGLDLIKTLQLVLGYEVVARAHNHHYLQLDFMNMKSLHGCEGRNW